MENGEAGAYLFHRIPRFRGFQACQEGFGFSWFLVQETQPTGKKMRKRNNH